VLTAFSHICPPPLGFFVGLQRNLLLSLSVRKWETKPGNPYARIYWEAVLGAREAILGARQSEVD
jgi:hypothetical protein